MDDTVATPPRAPAGTLRTIGRFGLAAVLLTAGIGHFRQPQEFLAQVPPWFPAPETTVFVSGVVEITLAGALAGAPARRRVEVGWLVAAFFVVIFPGNIAQLTTETDAFGLDSQRARWIRLAFQPVLVAWALWSTGAWRAWRQR